MLFSVPNIITYVRIGLIPLLVFLLALVDESRSLEHNKAVCQWATLVFTIAGVSDLIDGYYARRFGAVSVMGKFIDPMADKLIHMTALVMLIPLGRIAAGLVVVILFREIFISGLRAVAAGQGLIIDAAKWGKRKTAWYNFGIGGLIYYYPFFLGTKLELNTYSAAFVCVLIGVIYSLASAWVYVADFFRMVRKNQ